MSGIKTFYINLYVDASGTKVVSGRKFYLTQAEAEAEQKTPPGYRWKEAIKTRPWGAE